MKSTRLTIHVFDSFGIQQGSVRRTNVRGRAGAPIVTVSGLLRECVRLSGTGWAVFLGAKAKLPGDMRRAR